MYKKLRLPLAVLVLAALMLTGCGRLSVTGSEDTQKPENSASAAPTDSDSPAPKPSAEPSESLEPQTPGPEPGPELVPYSEVQGQSVLYGYMDSKSNVVIAPKFFQAEPFYDSGVAIVSDTVGNTGLIDKTGKYVVNPGPGYLFYSDGVFQRYSDADGMTYGYDKYGSQLFRISGYISSFSDGMAVSYGDTDSGYIDATGKFVLTPPYNNLGNFVDGMARVAEDYSGPALLIDKSGKDLTDTVSSGIRIVKDTESGLFGYADKNGNPITGNKFSEAEPFMDGLAVVNASPDFAKPSYGIINEKGEYALKPVYTGIQRMRNGSFAVGPAVTGDNYVPQEYFVNTSRAMFSKDLKNSTDWIFVSLEDYDREYICVNDGKRVYYIDSELNQAKGLPEFKGNGLMGADGDQFRGTLDDCTTVADSKGNILVQDRNLTLFSDGAYSETVTEYPESHATVRYPVLKGMKDGDIQDKLNKLIRDHAMSPLQSASEDTEDPYYFMVYYINSSLKITKDLMQVGRSVDQYKIGANHGSHFRDILFANIKNGNIYTLADLFKSPDDAVKYISGTITDKIREKPDDYLVEGVTPDQIAFFYLSDGGINVYFAEYEIAAYVAGMPEFYIPFADLKDYINYDGEFWKAFN